MAETVFKNDYVPPVDSAVYVTITSNCSEVYITVEPPEHGGKEVTFEAIMQELKNYKVCYGLNVDEIKRIADDRLYNERTLVAEWTPAVNGVDGTITYRFEKQVKIAPVEDENGFVDYKNLGLIRIVHAGDVIADITHPTEGEPGTDVKGQTLRQIPGKKASFTVGTNTELNEDETQIIATTDGNINFKGGTFAVDQVVTIAGDVDASVGNITFVGDVVVKGEVMEGFKIASKGNIIVSGNVNGATLECDGDIVIKKGCINSKVVAHGSVSINFCEHSNIRCDGDLSSSNFVICDVYCGNLSVKGTHGGLMGGSYTSLTSVEISNIGTKNYTPTVLTVGDNALLSEEKNELLKQMSQQQKTLDDLTLVINFLNEKKKELRSLPEDKEVMLGNACRQKIVMGMDIKKIQKRIDEIDTSLSNKQFLSIGCKGYMYPGVKIIINDQVFKAEAEYVRTRVSLSEDGIIHAAPL